MAIRVDRQTIRALLPEVDLIQDRVLAEAVLDIWVEVAAECPWERLEDVPKNTTDEKDRPLLTHVRGVTRMAVALAQVAEELYGLRVNRDHLVAACLLHDASKPLEYAPGEDRQPAKSHLGKSLQHGVYAAHKILQKRLPLDLAHLVVTHTHESNVRTETVEGALLFYADFADTDVHLCRRGRKPFVARWHLPG
ncbi:MAG: HD domain-containing protein [Nitrospinota bacterium]